MHRIVRFEQFSDFDHNAAECAHMPHNSIEFPTQFFIAAHPIDCMFIILLLVNVVWLALNTAAASTSQLVDTHTAQFPCTHTHCMHLSTLLIRISIGLCAFAFRDAFAFIANALQSQFDARTHALTKPNQILAQINRTQKTNSKLNGKWKTQHSDWQIRVHRFFEFVQVQQEKCDFSRFVFLGSLFASRRCVLARYI